jgi:hypothetical protein
MNNLRRVIPFAVIAAVVAFFSIVGDAEEAQAGGNTNWKLVRILKQSDAELVDAGGTSKTITLDGIYAGGAAVEIEDVYVDIKTAFDRTTDGGPTTFAIDIGKSGATKKYANSVDLQATTDKLGASTLLWAGVLDGGSTQFMPPFVEASGVAPVITVTSGTANISTNNVGEAHIYVKYGPLPKK